MKVVINTCFGGFSVSESCAKALGMNSPYSDIERTDERLIRQVEMDALNASGSFAKLKVVEIPDEVTDWEIDGYDGVEDIIYVLDGKLHHHLYPKT